MSLARFCNRAELWVALGQEGSPAASCPALMPLAPAGLTRWSNRGGDVAWLAAGDPAVTGAKVTAISAVKSAPDIALLCGGARPWVGAERSRVRRTSMREESSDEAKLRPTGLLRQVLVSRAYRLRLRPICGRLFRSDPL